MSLITRTVYCMAYRTGTGIIYGSEILSPEVTRPEPLYLQIAARYKQMIMSGEIRPGDQLPSVRDIARSWDVGHSIAQQVIGYLRTEGMARTSPDGTFAMASRVKYGPQQESEDGAAPEPSRRRSAPPG